MLKEVSLNTNVNSINIDSNIFDYFQSLYVLAKTKKDQKALNSLFILIRPTLVKWDLLYQNKNYYSDITIYTLMRLLQADNKTPGSLDNKLKLLNIYLTKNNMSFLDICIEAFILHMNKKSKVPKNGYYKIKNFLFYIAKEIKMFIFSIIRKYILEVNRDLLYKTSATFDYFIIEPFIYTDYSILQTFDDEYLRMYLYKKLTFLIPSKENKNFKNILDLTQKREHLCQLTKQMLSSN